ETRRQRNRRDPGVLDDLADGVDSHAIGFATQVEHQVLPYQFEIFLGLSHGTPQKLTKSFSSTESVDTTLCAAPRGLAGRALRALPDARSARCCSVLKNCMTLCSCSAWLLISSAVAESSSEAEALAWVVLESSTMAPLIWSIPERCSCDAAAISLTRSAVLPIDGSISSSSVP